MYSKYSLIMDTCRKIHAILDNVSVEEYPLSAGAPRPLRGRCRMMEAALGRGPSPIEKHAVRANCVAPLGEVGRSPAWVERLH